MKQPLALLYNLFWNLIHILKGLYKIIAKSLDTQFLFQNRSIYGFEMKSTFDSGKVRNKCKALHLMAITRKVSGFSILFFPPENKYFRHFLNQNRESNLHRIKISVRLSFFRHQALHIFQKK